MEQNSTFFSFKDPRQERIHERLLLLGPGPAALYYDVCSLMDEDSKLKSTSHLVAHLFREIESALRSALKPMSREKLNGSSSEKHKAEIKAILQGLEISETDPVGQAWLSLADKNSDFQLHSSAHRNGLEAPRAVNSKTRAWWRDIDTILDVVLKRFEANYFAIHDFLDQLLIKKNPSRRDARDLKEHCPSSLVALGYFLDRVEEPTWLSLLAEKDYFQNPTEPQLNEEGDTIRTPLWPQSNYLKRMASVVPQDVKEIILRIPETQNSTTNYNLTDAALKMPPHVAAELVPRTILWIETCQSLWMTDNCAQLVSHLSVGNEMEAALDLARALLSLFLEPVQEKSTEETGRNWSRTEPAGHMDNWHYGEILKEIISPLSKYGDLEGFKLFCDLLEQATQLTVRSNSSTIDKDRYHKGPPAIEDHEQNQTHSTPRVHLVFAVRDAAEMLIEEHGKTVLDVIESKDYFVFTRIGLHLRRKFPDVDFEGTVRILSSAETFDETDLYHELFHLLGTVFGKLPEETQACYFQRVQAAREMEPARERLKIRIESPSDAQVERYLRHCEFDELIPVKEHLTDEWKERFDQLSEEFEERKHPDFLSYIGSFERIPSESPQTQDELGSMSIDNLIGYLADFEIVDEPFYSSVEGLERELERLISSSPNYYAPVAERFEVVEPEFVRKYLSGMWEAARSETVFDAESWEPVLQLCSWVVKQDRDHPPRKGSYSDLDLRWGWTRKVIVDLVEEGVKSNTNQIPFKLRKLVWEVLQPLTEDPDPTPERDQESLSGADLSINTVRCLAAKSTVVPAYQASHQGVLLLGFLQGCAQENPLRNCATRQKLSRTHPPTTHCPCQAVANRARRRPLNASLGTRPDRQPGTAPRAMPRSS